MGKLITWILIAIAAVSLAVVMAYPRNAGAAGVTIYWQGPTNPPANSQQVYKFSVTNGTADPIVFKGYPQCGFPANSAFCSGVPGQTTVTVPVGATVEVPFALTVLNPGVTFQVYGFYKVDSQTRWLSKYLNVTPVAPPTSPTKRTYIPILEK